MKRAGADWGPKITIRIDLPEPEPDPPDEVCMICGGRYEGWKRQYDGPAPAVCWNCQHSVPTRYFRITPYSQPLTVLVPGLAPARAALYFLEKEIGRHAS